MKYLITVSILLLSISAKPSQKIINLLENLSSKIPEQKKAISQANPTNSNVRAILKTGFTYYSQQSSVIFYEGVEESSLDEFLAYLNDVILEVPDGNKKDFIDTFEEIKLCDTKLGVNFKLIYSNSQADCNYINVIADRSGSTTQWLVTKINTTFKLAPSILIITESKSYFFGLIKSTTTRIETIPQTIQPTDVQLIQSFFDVVAVEKMARFIKDSSYSNYLE